MFDFLKDFSAADITNRIGIGVGHGESCIGAGIEAAGRAIKMDGLKRQMRNRAEFFVRHKKHTLKSLKALYFHTEAIAVETLTQELLDAAMSSTEVVFLTSAEYQTYAEQFIAELTANPTV